MKADRLNDDLLYLIEVRNSLHKLAYNDDKYDGLEEEFQTIEDDFVAKYGGELDKVLKKIHEGVAPDSEVLRSTAYLSKEYIQTGESDEGEPIFRIRANEGIPVDTRFDDPEGNAVNGLLVILPSPFRFALTVNKQTIMLWSAEEPEKFNV